jgi:CubicO group peptidase (beta-lactamase class C family)
LDSYIQSIQSQIGCTASAVFVIHKDNVIHERYWGRHSNSASARATDTRTQFNVASIRKTYLALAISLLIENRLIASIDDAISDYLPDYAGIATGVTLRHNYYDSEDNCVGPNDSSAGDQSNLFVSARELAAWGQLHLHQGKLRQDGERLFPKAVFNRIRMIQTPDTVPQSMPRNGFI